MTNDIPERLRERALDTINATGVLVPQTVLDAVATALYEIEQAARAEGERAGAEAMREAADAPFAEWLRQFGDVKIDCVPADKYARDAITDIRENVRALPAPAVPAKEA